MADAQERGIETHGSSHGHALSGTDWLDAHFEACRPEYEAMLRSVGLQPGWHVLDAGCGSGGFLPLIAEAVGPTGRITALDLASENIAAVQEAFPPSTLACPIATEVGSAMGLSFADGQFDAVWFANVSQYLTDGELATVLGEFCRVVKPGGLVAIKEFAASPWTFGPGDPARMWHFLDATRTTLTIVHGDLRARDLRRWLERKGCEAVWQKTTLIERWAPLRLIERQYIGDLFTYLAQLAEDADLPEDDHAFWRTTRDPNAADHVMNDPEFYWCEASVVAVGRIPRV